MKILKTARLVSVSLALVLMTFALNSAAVVKLARKAQPVNQAKQSSDYCHCQRMGAEYWLCCWTGKPDDPDCNQVEFCSNR